MCSRWERAYLACSRTWVQYPAPHKLHEVVLISGPGKQRQKDQQVKGLKSSAATQEVQGQHGLQKGEGEERERETRGCREGERALAVILYSPSVRGPAIGDIPGNRLLKQKSIVPAQFHIRIPQWAWFCFAFLTETKNTFSRMPIRHQPRLDCSPETCPESRPGCPFSSFSSPSPPPSPPALL